MYAVNSKKVKENMRSRSITVVNSDVEKSGKFVRAEAVSLCTAICHSA